MDLKKRHELRFHGDGTFRILMISDFHAGRSFDPKMTRGMDALLDETEPDLVMLGGDQCLVTDTPEQLGPYLASAVAPMESRHIPWAHVFGNHDYEMPLTVAQQEPVYESMEYCLSSSGPEDVSGVCNYVLPVLSHDGRRTAFNVWGLDSHRENTDYTESFGLPENTRYVLPDHFGAGSRQASPFFDQVMWYYTESLRLERENGARIPAVMFMHVPLLQFDLIWRDPEETGMEGSMRDTVCSSELDPGLFMACLQRGDVKGIFAGHEHLNDFSGVYCGITLAYDSCIGYNMSAHDDLRGGRVIDLSEDGTMTTRHIKLMELLGRDAMRDKDFFEGGCKYFIRNFH